MKSCFCFEIRVNSRSTRLPLVSWVSMYSTPLIRFVTLFLTWPSESNLNPPGALSSTRLELDLRKLVSEKGSNQNVLLQDRDILVIPALEEKVYVNGGVYNPGAFDYQPNLTVMDYIGMAGGATTRGNLKRTLVLRADGSRTAAPLGRPSPPLHRGDTILVPEVALKWWQDYVTLVTAVSSVVISWLVIRN